MKKRFTNSITGPRLLLTKILFNEIKIPRKFPWNFLVNYDLAGWGFIVHYKLIISFNLDYTAFGVFNAQYWGGERCVYFAFFKGKVAIYHFAINKSKIFAIAKRLGADDYTIFKCEIFGIPAKIFALDCGIYNGNVFGVPKCVLGIEIAIFK